MPPRAPLAARHTGARMCPSAWPAPPGRDRAPAPSFSSLRLRAGPTHPPVRLPERHRVSPLGRRCPQAHTCGATPRCRRRRHGGTRARARQGRLQVRGGRGDRGAMRGFRAGVALRGDLQPPEATAISDERVRLKNGTRLLKGTHESHISHPCAPSRAGDSWLGAVVCGATPSPPAADRGEQRCGQGGPQPGGAQEPRSQRVVAVPGACGSGVGFLRPWSSPAGGAECHTLVKAHSPAHTRQPPVQAQACGKRGTHGRVLSLRHEPHRQSLVDRKLFVPTSFWAPAAASPPPAARRPRPCRGLARGVFIWSPLCVPALSPEQKTE